jgi:hypothetical protein
VAGWRLLRTELGALDARSWSAPLYNLRVGAYNLLFIVPFDNFSLRASSLDVSDEIDSWNFDLTHILWKMKKFSFIYLWVGSIYGQTGSPLQSFGNSPMLRPIPIDQIKARIDVRNFRPRSGCAFQTHDFIARDFFLQKKVIHRLYYKHKTYFTNLN